MTIKQQIDRDLKTALLGGDKSLATTLRGIKSVILYAEVAEGKRDQGLTDEALIPLLQKEAKKRQESADLYQSAGDQARAETELSEKKIIENYLPVQLSDEALTEVVEQAIAELEATSMQDMGAVIAKVKQAVGGQADGGRIAQTVKARLK